MPLSLGARGHLRRENVLGADLAAVVAAPPAPPPTAPPSASPPPRRSASCAPRRRSPRTACPASPPAPAPPRARTGRSGWCRRRSSCRRESASASWPLLLPLSLVMVATTPVRALEVEDRLLQLRVDHVAVGDDDHRVEQLLVAARRAGRRGSAPSRRWSWSCPTPPSAGSDTCRPAPRPAPPPAAFASRRAGGSAGR